LRTDPKHDAERFADARTIEDAEGVQWMVYELPVSSFRRNASLVFESGMAVRRVRHYPTRWRELSAEELVALSWRR
jgi:hypothetical protein